MSFVKMSSCRSGTSLRRRPPALAFWLLGILVYGSSHHTFIIKARAQPTSVLDVIASRPELTELAKLVNAAGLNSTLAGLNNNVTAFLPNNLAVQSLATQLGMSNTAALAEQDPKALRKLLLFHIATSSYSSANLSALPVFADIRTMLAGTIPNSQTAVVLGSLVIRPAPSSTGASVTLIDLSGSSASLVTADISITSGRVVAYAHIVDSVLKPWYANVSQALRSNIGDRSSFYFALQANGLLSMLDNPDPDAKAYPYNVFAYTDLALDEMVNRLKVDLTLPSASNRDILNYQIARHDPGAYAEVVNRNPDFTQAGSYPLRTLRGSNLNVVVYGNLSTVTAGSFLMAGDTRLLALIQLPVGGLTPTAYVNVISAKQLVIMPVYITVYQYLTTQPDVYSQLLTLLETSAANEIYMKLSSPESMLTFLAPPNLAIDNFLKVAMEPSLDIYFGQDPQKGPSRLLKNHAIIAPRNLSTFYNSEVVGTLKESLSVQVGGGGSITFIARKTRASVILRSPQYKDVSILYGRSIVQQVDNLLVPSDMFINGGNNDGNGGAATAAMPSLVLLVAAFLVGHASMRMLQLY